MEVLRPVGSWGWEAGNQILLCRGSFLANCFVCCFMKPYFGFSLLFWSCFCTVSVWNGAKCQLQCWRECASQQSQQIFEFCPFFEPHWWLDLCSGTFLTDLFLQQHLLMVLSFKKNQILWKAWPAHWSKNINCFFFFFFPHLYHWWASHK